MEEEGGVEKISFYFGVSLPILYCTVAEYCREKNDFQSFPECFSPVLVDENTVFLCPKKHAKYHG